MIKHIVKLFRSKFAIEAVNWGSLRAFGSVTMAEHSGALGSDDVQLAGSRRQCKIDQCVRNTSFGHRHCCSSCRSSGGARHTKRCEAQLTNSSNRGRARSRSRSQKRRDNDTTTARIAPLSKCPICHEELMLDSGQSVSIVPCGHMYCAACRLERCAICRGPITSTMRLFPS